MNPQPSSFNIVNTLTLIIVIGYAGLMPLWMFYPPTGVSEGIVAIINQMMGAWGMAFGAAIQYHLGSSKTAKEAQDAQRGTVETLSATAATAATTAATVAQTAAMAAGAVVGIVPGSTNGAAEIAAWAEATTASTPASFTAYLQKYPTGAHAAEAQARLTALGNP